ncbi:tryptophan-rich sensory protein [Candidatus Nomurabacteria bacterium]|nr:tryptophan-rich sensory protein [Candidatus Nomurabacteria bacterium]
MTLNNFFKLVIAITISEMAGVIGAVFTTPAVQSYWYAGIVKPAFNPPAWVFGPVWTTLYALMGISLFLIWKQHPYILENVRMLRIWKIGIAAFFIQLVLNTLWSIIFFGLHSPGGALIEIVFLWLAILATIIAFYKISPPCATAGASYGGTRSSSIWTTAGHGKLAAWLLAPYILWVSFAGYLNYAIWSLN